MNGRRSAAHGSAPHPSRSPQPPVRDVVAHPSILPNPPRTPPPAAGGESEPADGQDAEPGPHPAPWWSGAAHDWLDALAAVRTADPLPRAELRELLDELTEQLAEQLTTGGEFDDGAGTAVGRALVEAGFGQPEALAATVDVLGRRLLPPPPAPPAQRTAFGPAAAGSAPPPEEVLRRLTRLQGTVAAGCAAALHERTVAEQEAVRRSMLTARVRASRAMQSLHDSEARFRGVFDAAAIGVAVAALDGRLLEVNDSFAAMLGLDAEQLLRAPLPRLAHRDDAARLEAALAALSAPGAPDHSPCKARFRSADGRLRWTHLTLSPVRDPAGAPQHLIALVEDVTDRHRLHARLAHQATHDPLTGLANRSLFHERLTALFDAPRAGARFGLCHLDLDNFQELNETAGHEVGDELLTRVARRLHDALAGPGRLVARLGGDEFVVLLEDSNGPDDARWAARAALRAARCAFGKAGQEVRISASAGVVERAVEGCDAAEAMRAADMTLHWAKAGGKDRYAVFDARRDARQTARYRLAAQLPRALERGEFFVLYQPIVRLRGAVPRHPVVSAEALVRWRHPEHGVLAPGSFIDLAEENGMIDTLGRFVLEESCRQAERWWRGDPAGAPTVSVNLSPRQCADEALPERVAKVLTATGLPAARLQLELTESAVMQGGRPLAALWELSAMGVRVVLDDFGTGYSNLSYLRSLPVGGLKIDRSFVQGLRGAPVPGAPAPVDERIVAALVQLARAMDLSVTVEGVETAAQASRLARLGCELGQGLLFGGPGPAGPAGPLDAAEEPDALHVGEQAQPGSL